MNRQHGQSYRACPKFIRAVSRITGRGCTRILLSPHAVLKPSLKLMGLAISERYRVEPSSIRAMQAKAHASALKHRRTNLHLHPYSPRQQPSSKEEPLPPGRRYQDQRQRQEAVELSVHFRRQARHLAAFNVKGIHSWQVGRRDPTENRHSDVLEGNVANVSSRHRRSRRGLHGMITVGCVVDGEQAQQKLYLP